MRRTRLAGDTFVGPMERKGENTAERRPFFVCYNRHFQSKDKAGRKGSLFSIRP